MQENYLSNEIHVDSLEGLMFGRYLLSKLFGEEIDYIKDPRGIVYILGPRNNIFFDIRNKRIKLNNINPEVFSEFERIKLI